MGFVNRAKQCIFVMQLKQRKSLLKRELSPGLLKLKDSLNGSKNYPFILKVKNIQLETPNSKPGAWEPKGMQFNSCSNKNCIPKIYRFDSDQIAIDIFGCPLCPGLVPGSSKITKI